jgi:16S rRNA (cytidine1402-2'-O)-methyltransferase
MKTLYLVGVPAEDPEDVTLRAVRILKEVSLIVAPDLGSLSELLRRYDVETPVLQLDRDNVAREVEHILGQLEEGDVAWAVERLADLPATTARWLLELAGLGVPLVSVPGPCVEITGLVASGLPAGGVTFLGSLPAASQARIALLERVAGEPFTLVCDVQAGDLPAALADIEQALGERRVAIYRAHHLWRGKAGQVPAPPAAGRFTLVVEGAEQGTAWTEDVVRAQVRAMLAQGRSARDVAREVASRSGWPRRKVYELCHLVERDGI